MCLKPNTRSSIKVWLKMNRIRNVGLFEDTALHFPSSDSGFFVFKC